MIWDGSKFVHCWSPAQRTRLVKIADDRDSWAKAASSVPAGGQDPESTAHANLVGVEGEGILWLLVGGTWHRFRKGKLADLPDIEAESTWDAKARSFHADYLELRADEVPKIRKHPHWRYALAWAANAQDPNTYLLGWCWGWEALHKDYAGPFGNWAHRIVPLGELYPMNAWNVEKGPRAPEFPRATA